MSDLTFKCPAVKRFPPQELAPLLLASLTLLRLPFLPCEFLSLPLSLDFCRVLCRPRLGCVQVILARAVKPVPSFPKFIKSEQRKVNRAPNNEPQYSKAEENRPKH